MKLWLDCLGGCALSRDGAPAALPARKARMLLGLLATARRRTMPRMRLAALLWEASDGDQARVSLRQALAQIRRSAGEGWVEAEGDDLRLGDAVGTDLDAFQAALTRNDPVEAARLYRGPFLEGLDASTPDLGQAIAAERARLAGLASEALARALDRADDGADASALAHRLLRLDPLNELAHRRLMQIDAAHGMRGAARARFESLEAALRRDMNSAPEPETRALYDRIRRGGGKIAMPGAVEAPAPAATDPAGYLLLGMEAEGVPDYTMLRDRASGHGAFEQDSGPGEIALVYRDMRLREVCARALELSEAAGGTLSFGLVPFDGQDDGAARSIAQARRMAARADPGSILATRDLAARVGLAIEPDQSMVPLRPDAMRARPVLPLVGRAMELAQLEAAVAGVRQSSSSLTVHLSGEAGIGKSRLASEVIRLSEQAGMVIAVCGFDAFSPGSRHLAQRMMAGLSAPPVPDPEAQPIERAIWRWLTDPEDEAEARLRLSALDPQAQQERILDVLSAALKRAADVTGLLILIEDCHWRPDGAGDFILALQARLRDSPILLLLTERPHPGSLDHRIATRARSGLSRISLAPLPEAAARELVQAVAPGFASAEEAIDRAAGHPLFLIRLIEAGWTAGALPATVTELVQEQIERLPEQERAALRTAAILGASFDPEDMSAIFPETASLRANGDLLHETETGLAFGHDLIHRAVYESIPEETRQTWHARAAAHFRGHDPISWAEHALKAADDADAGHAAVAAANAMIAARRFSAAYPYLEAGFARDSDAEASAELYSCRAGIRRVRGDMAGALEDYRAAHARAIRSETRVAMLCRQALVLHRLGRGDEADRALDAAEEIADDIGLTGSGRAEIHEQRGNRAFVRGDHAACMRHHRAALAAAEATGAPRGIARGHGGIGDAAYAAGRLATAYRHFTKAIETAEQAGLGLVREEYLFMRAFALFFAEPGPQASLLSDIAVDSAVQCGAVRTEMIAREVRAEMRLANGDLAGLEEDLQAIEKLASTRGENRFSKDVETLYAFLEWRRGNADAARRRLAPLLPDAVDDAYIGGTILGLAAICAESTAERDRTIADGLTCLERGALSHAVIWFHSSVIERAISDADRDLARRHMDALTSYAAEEPIGLASLYVRSAELLLWPSEPEARRVLATDLRAACLEDMARMLENSGSLADAP
ncbi:AAA family ATPase [Sagittula sp.]|uniref:AAA family ATPase n=1 Tax=Sagittula sp. TaxID=2038081 RepID=UPI0035178969